MIMTVHPVDCYGQLRFQFSRALKGSNLLKLAFMPKTAAANTYVLRLLMITLCAMIGATVIWNSPWVFLATLVLEGAMIYVAELEMRRGVRNAFPSDDAVGNLDRQDWQLQRLIIRYVYFKRRLALEGILPSRAQLSAALQMIEIERTGRPPAWTSVFRHPVFILLLGTVAYAFNTKIVGRADAVVNLPYFWAVCCGAFVFAGMMVIAHGLRYAGASQQWQFECCLRWYMLERGEGDRRPAMKHRNARRLPPE